MLKQQCRLFMAVVCLVLISSSMMAQRVTEPTVTINAHNEPLSVVLNKITDQTRQPIYYDNSLLNATERVSLTVDKKSIDETLSLLLNGRSITWTRRGNNIVLMRAVATKADSSQKFNLRGRVIDSIGRPVPGASISVSGTGKRTTTNNEGEFQFTDIANTGQLIVGSIGFKTMRVAYNTGLSNVELRLSNEFRTIAEVEIISTGYQKLPKERATGSFVQLDNAIISRAPTTNIIDRLNGVTSGLLFNNFAVKSVAKLPSNNQLGINIRGQSTLSNLVTTDPLIILDNFPYAGDLSSINPNDIESVTVLKDAAAASIWGAQSGNGVIVMTTKKGKLNSKMAIDFTTNFTLIQKPDLFADKNYINSTDYINIEKKLFSLGYFDDDLNNKITFPALSPVTELLNKVRNGQISQSDADKILNGLSTNDIRHDFSNDMYQRGLNQQYALSLRGGSNNATYSVSGSIDNNKDNLIRNSYRRYTTSAYYTYSPIKRLEITTAINYSYSQTEQNNEGYGSINIGGDVGSKYGDIYPYAQLKDGHGNAMAITRAYNTYFTDSISRPGSGFLNWQYKPIDELNNADNYTKVSNLVLRMGLKYKFFDFLSAEVMYSNERQKINSYKSNSIASFYTRDLINQFTTLDPSGLPSYKVPLGGILDLDNYDWNTNNARVSLNFDKTFATKHNITAIIGEELREQLTEGYDRRSYGYNAETGVGNNYIDFSTAYPVIPNRYNNIPAPSSDVYGTTRRYISYFTNIAYNLYNKYTLTVSARKDGSNIFGVSTNEKIVPLWSTGLGWNISKEPWYNKQYIPYLNFRSSYGFNGNVYNGAAVVTGVYSTSYLNGDPWLVSITPPNPELRWEKVQNVNLGVDFALKNNIIKGTIEYFQKNGKDLIQTNVLAPSTGFPVISKNSASTKAHGWDITLSSDVSNGNFRWNGTLLFSAINDRITDYYQKITSLNFLNLTGMGNYVVGKPIYAIFSYKWAGLDPQTGDPQGYLNGKVSKDYPNIIKSVDPDSLVYNGSSRPTKYGSFRNDFSYKGFSLSVNVTFKFGYYFRRPSTMLNYTDIISYNGNEDYQLRWQKLGDEKTTSVPSVIYPTDQIRSNFYQLSEVLVEKGDHIRLQDVRLSYNINTSLLSKLKINQLQIYAFASNLGILWRANKFNLDPDLNYTMAGHLWSVPRQYSFGLKVTY